MAIADVIGFVTANWDVILQGALAAVGLASVIVKLTPTPKDDSILAVVIGILAKVALNKPVAPPAPPAPPVA